MIALGLTGKSLSAVKRKLMKPTRRPRVNLISVRNRDVLMNAQSIHKWGYTLKSAVFGLSSSLAPHVGGGGGSVCESVGKADLLSDYVDGMQSMESVDLPLTCHPSPGLTTFAFRSSEVRRPLLDLDLIRALTHWVCFLFFLRELPIVWPPILV